MKEWQQCLEMLGDAKVGEDGSIEGPEDQNMEKDAEDQEINVCHISVIYYSVVFLLATFL
jgi:hypothetical protein